MRAKSLVVWAQFDCCHDVSHRFVYLLSLLIGNTSQVVCLGRAFVKFNRLCALIDCFLVKTGVVRANGHVLQNSLLEAFELITIVTLYRLGV